jgi:hypothetical protein
LEKKINYLIFKILVGPEIVETQSSLYSIENSPSVILDCIVKSNPSITILEWFKDKYLLSNTNKYQILANNSLMIRNVQKMDRGAYFCSCNNTIKKIISQPIRLEIIDQNKAEFTSMLASSSQAQVILPCAVLDASASSHLPQSSKEVLENSISLNSYVKWYKVKV